MYVVGVYAYAKSSKLFVTLTLKYSTSVINRTLVKMTQNKKIENNETK